MDKILKTLCDYTTVEQLLFRGKILEALRLAILLAQENPLDFNAWYEIIRLCIKLGQKPSVAESFLPLGLQYAENGNLPMAAVCIKEAEKLSIDCSELKDKVSKIYSRNSKRTANKQIPVPPVPVYLNNQTINNLPLEKKFLLDEALKTLSLLEGSAKISHDTAATHQSVPYFPLFSALNEKELSLLLDCFEAIHFKKGSLVIKKGEKSRSLYLIARGEVVVYRGKEEIDLENFLQQKPEQFIATLGPGAFIGEMGIVAKTPRSANVMTTTQSILLCAPIDSIEKLAETTPMIAEVIVAFCEVRLLENVMASSNILKPIEQEKRPDAISMFERIYISSGQIIIQEGQAPKGIYLVVSGQVAVTKKLKKKADDYNEERIFITSLGEGDIFGEISTVMKKPATATVHAITDTALLFLPKEKLIQFGKKYPQSFEKIYEVVSVREEEMEKIMKGETKKIHESA